MRPSAKIDEVTASVCRSQTIFWYFVLDELNLEWIIGEHLQSLSLAQQDPFVWLFFLSVFLDFLLDGFVISLRESLSSDEGVIEETVIQRRAVAQPSTIDIFQALAEKMGTGMPEDFFSHFIIKGKQLQQAVSLEWSREINKLVLFIMCDSLLLCFCADRPLSKRRLVSFCVLNLGYYRGFS